MIVMENLIDNLLSISELQEKATLVDNRIVISFHDEYKLEITNRLAIHINGIFYDYIDDQDFFEFIKDLAIEAYVVMKKKKGIFDRSPFTIRYKPWIEKNFKRLRVANGIKVFSAKETLINNFN